MGFLSQNWQWAVPFVLLILLLGGGYLMSLRNPSETKPDVTGAFKDDKE